MGWGLKLQDALSAEGRFPNTPPRVGGRGNQTAPAPWIMTTGREKSAKKCGKSGPRNLAGAGDASSPSRHFNGVKIDDFIVDTIGDIYGYSRRVIWDDARRGFPRECVTAPTIRTTETDLMLHHLIERAHRGRSVRRQIVQSACLIEGLEGRRFFTGGLATPTLTAPLSIMTALS